ncbi:CPBP family intramembrane glutamic endopeptidase [Bacillus velezensis]|uniref:CPBP family intramembrane glutamic endopeptidase n=1 Tax=Bacillus velezensis TaxID=492670 RepID=UPI0008499DB9|nr:MULTISPECIES: CPBP family intramembrane glutamic endopeptidase [Bacillus amyloliquefaciens group]MBO3792679.1 CPBP family intramembrane metalloprotease [Bacillus velezensis]MDX7895564.1 CPBP family intramembrane glutamic endopeptidase [Bacillus velezensis]MDX8025603.1 CPBP family intramembrane glutamic endopeptidase [Bacillus velezensis]MDX8199793.1 CPBP family intramembrane glutamic endopeptidase [Bacillus velezensis]MDX8225562.1 CPBP family intramembrane glutamic endopeptidase [Bacillus v
MNTFVRPAEGRNSVSRYLLSLLLIVGLFFFGSILTVFYMFLTSAFNPSLTINWDEAALSDPLADIYLQHIVYFIAIPGIWIAVRFIMKRRFLSIITPNQSLNWKRIFFGFGTYVVLMFVAGLIDFLIHPDRFTLQEFHASRFLLLLAAAVLLVPIQTSAEEFLFRGFLLQFAGKLTANAVVLTVIIGGLFGALHFGNPEMENGALWAGIGYVTIGMIWTFITIKTGSLEMSLGGHAANNMFLFIFLTEDHSVYGGIPSIFTTAAGGYEIYDCISTLVINIIFAWLVFRFVKKEKQQAA